MLVSEEALQSLRETVSVWAQSNLKVDGLDDAEEAAEYVRQICGEAVLEQSLKQSSGRATYAGSRIGCVCGGEARFMGYRSRWVKTVCGECQVERAYYHCASCGEGHLPWDRAAGLDRTMWSARLKAVVAEMSGYIPYGTGVGLLERLGVVRLEESSAEAIVLKVGERLRAAEDALVREFQQSEERVVAQAERSGRLYIGIDAAKAHVEGSWHDMKVATLYEGLADSQGQDKAVRQEYVAAQEASEGFGWRVYARTRARGLEKFAECVVMGDGASFIWNEAAHHFPAATQVLDFWHASEHIWALSQKLYPPESPQGKRWAQERIRSLKADGPRPLIRALGRRKPKTVQAQESLRLERGYFATNRVRMDYPAYRARGLMIGSGPVEAGCKIIVGQRLKQAGMRWSRQGADAMLAVRTCLLSQRSEQLAQMARAA